MLNQQIRPPLRGTAGENGIELCPSRGRWQQLAFSRHDNSMRRANICEDTVSQLECRAHPSGPKQAADLRGFWKSLVLGAGRPATRVSTAREVRSRKPKYDIKMLSRSAFFDEEIVPDNAGSSVRKAGLVNGNSDFRRGR